jgi:hypothetical protein
VRSYGSGLVEVARIYLLSQRAMICGDQMGYRKPFSLFWPCTWPETSQEASAWSSVPNPVRPSGWWRSTENDSGQRTTADRERQRTENDSGQRTTADRERQRTENDSSKTRIRGRELSRPIMSFKILEGQAMTSRGGISEVTVSCTP